MQFESDQSLFDMYLRDVSNRVTMCTAAFTLGCKDGTSRGDIEVLTENKMKENWKHERGHHPLPGLLDAVNQCLTQYRQAQRQMLLPLFELAKRHESSMQQVVLALLQPLDFLFMIRNSSQQMFATYHNQITQITTTFKHETEVESYIAKHNLEVCTKTSFVCGFNCYTSEFMDLFPTGMFLFHSVSVISNEH